MKELDDKELKKFIQSGHINLLMGAGCSCTYISALGDIEKQMNNKKTQYRARKDYFKLIKKSKAILDESRETNKVEKDKLNETRENYESFLSFWAQIISERSLHIVNKQVNIFTTNFDMFIEDSCERLDIPYNDGFMGRIRPTFNVANFNKIQRYKSLQFDNVSDIPLFNIIKLHGSVSWQEEDNNIFYSNGSHIDDNLGKEKKPAFIEGYRKIAVVNPNAEKHFETVLDTNYASMLRKFTLELEKENSVLLIVGFSLADRHIRGLLQATMKSNPTLIVIYFSYDEYDASKQGELLKEGEYSNFYIISPKPGFSFKETTEHLVGVFENPDSE